MSLLCKLAVRGPGIPGRSNNVSATRPIQWVAIAAQRVMASWVTIVAAVGAAALLAVVLAVSAQAATGVFRYEAHGTSRSVTNPAPGACLRTLNAVRATNETSGTIELYSSPDCSGLVRTLGRGESLSVNFNSAKSLP
jgi:hypothetical protein